MSAAVSLAACTADDPVAPDAAPRRASPPEPPPGPTGFRLASSPVNATVRLDGKDVGSTPIHLTGVGPGAHTIRLEAEGYAPWETDLTLTEGTVLSLRPAQLTSRSLSAASSVEPTTPAPAPKPEPLPRWRKGRGLPPDLELVLEKPARSSQRFVVNQTTVTLRGTRSGGSVTYRIEKEKGSVERTLPVSRAELARFFDGVADFVAHMQAPLSGPSSRRHQPGRRRSVSSGWLAMSMRAFGQKIVFDNAWSYSSLRGEVAERAARIIERPQGPDGALDLVDAELAKCVRFAAGAEVEYEIPRGGGKARPIRIATAKHERSEVECMRRAIEQTALPELPSPVRVAFYALRFTGAIPWEWQMSDRPREWGLIRMYSRPASALDDTVVDIDRPAELIEPKNNLLRMEPGRQTIVLFPPGKPNKRMELKVDVLRGRERSVFVDVSKMR